MSQPQPVITSEHVSLEHHNKLIRHACCFHTSQELRAVVMFGVADAMGSERVHYSEIAERTKTNPDVLYRLLRNLASIGLFEEDSHRNFKLTHMGHLLEKDAVGTLAPYIMYATSEPLWNSWAKFGEVTLATGQPAFDKLHGCSFFDTCLENNKFCQLIHKGLKSFTHEIVSETLNCCFEFGYCKSVIDIGGGSGYLLDRLVRMYPNITQAIVYDLPAVCAAKEKKMANPNIKFVPGDLMASGSLPEGGDVYLLKHILHNWNDEQCKKILCNVKQAMTMKSKLLIVDAVLPRHGDNKAHMFKDLDLQMATVTGGRERTRKEWSNMLCDVGFFLTHVIPTQAQVSIMEARITAE